MKKLGSFILELVQVVVFAVSIFLFVYLLVLQPHKIKGQSMDPNFHSGQYLLTDKISYRLGEPKRGDVIVFRAPPKHEDEFIKRVIGLPGDVIKIENGAVFLNNQELKEDYIPSDFVTKSAQFAREGMEITIPEESYFVLGDNREASLDSRNLGLIESEHITGRAWVVYWPLSELGTLPKISY